MNDDDQYHQNQTLTICTFSNDCKKIKTSVSTLVFIPILIINSIRIGFFDMVHMRRDN